MTTTGLYFVGEAIADQRPDPSDKRRMQVSLGGSMYFGSMGAARAITDAGTPDIKSFYVGPISKDHFGQIITGDFKDAGVGMDYVRLSDFISMIAVVSEDGMGGNKYSFYGRNQPNTTEHLRMSDLPQTFREDHKLFCFGSVATTLSPSGQTLKQFAELQRKKDAVILYDPNTRPSVIPDVVLYRAALESWVGTVSIAKASEEDVAFTYTSMTQDQVAARWLDLGVKAVFVTQGFKGCTVYTAGGGRNYIEGLSGKTITRTVGAGDNFNAGILLALARKGLSKDSALASLGNADWNAIATEANTTAYAHLLRINGH